MQVTVSVWYFLLRHGCKGNFLSGTLTLEQKKGEIFRLIFWNIQTELDCDQEKQRRWWTVKKKVPK